MKGLSKVSFSIKENRPFATLILLRCRWQGQWKRRFDDGFTLSSKHRFANLLFSRYPAQAQSIRKLHAVKEQLFRSPLFGVFIAMGNENVVFADIKSRPRLVRFSTKGLCFTVETTSPFGPEECVFSLQGPRMLASRFLGHSRSSVFTARGNEFSVFHVVAKPQKTHFQH